MQASRTIPALIPSSATAHLPPAASTTRILVHRPLTLLISAITEGMDGMEDYYTAEGGIVTVNTETAEALNIDTAVFKDFGDVVEVTDHRGLTSSSDGTLFFICLRFVS